MSVPTDPTISKLRLVAIVWITGSAVTMALMDDVASRTERLLIVSFYLVLLLALVAPIVMPVRARAWLSRRISAESTEAAFHRLNTRAADPSLPDLSVYKACASRRNKVSLPIVLIIGALLIASFFLPGGLLLLGTAATVALLVTSSRRGSRLEGHSIGLAGQELVEKDGQGAVTGRIDLARPFTWEYLDKTTGFAIYQLRQGAQRVEFSSESPLAGPIARDLLRTQWPPLDRFGF